MRPLLERQALHAALVGTLLVGLAFALAAVELPEREWLGLTTREWTWLASLDAVAHTAYVAVCWRLELHRRTLTRWLGERAFPLFGAGFTLFFVLRPVLVLVVASLDRGSLGLPNGVGLTASLALALPALWLGHSIGAHFGYGNAMGRDHFEPELRERGYVARGIFRYVRNPMYVFGLGALWIPAFAYDSTAALLAAAFQHAHIWAHYHCTERPDLARMYGER